jgi:hypothetical protein
MAKRQTAIIANSDLLNGEKLYQERARLTLPYLVRQAKAGQTIYYSDLAEEIDIRNPRNLNYVLGAIGNALIDLGKRTNTEIPPIQCVVINKRQELPGEGIGWFIRPADFGKLNKTQKQKVVAAQLTKIYTFQRWDWVLQQLKLDPVPTNLDDELEEAKIGRGGGESEQHKKFKLFISKNPSVLGLSADIANGQQEYSLPSADTVDVLFTDNDLKIGVEVKSSISNTADILRGLFQCVKYKYLIEAEQTINDKFPNSRIILALQGQFPDELSLVKNLLGIEVIDKIKTSR